MSVGMKRGLGKGLGALITEQKGTEDEIKTGIDEIDINKIEPNRKQPRKSFDDEYLDELAQSVRQYGILQPLIVKKVEDYYEIVAGERRFRAARIVGLTKIPVVVKEASDLESLEISLIENIQRKDLNPLEEADTYRRLADEFGLTQDVIAERVGKNRSTITNMLRLLNLDNRVKNFLLENKISASHARALLAVEDNELSFELAEKVIEDGLSVRDCEEMVSRELNKLEASSSTQSNTPEETVDLFKEIQHKIEGDLKKIFGTKVKVMKGKNKGKIEIEYYSSEDLDRLLGLMKKIDE